MVDHQWLNAAGALLGALAAAYAVMTKWSLRRQMMARGDTVKAHEMLRQMLVEQRRDLEHERKLNRTLRESVEELFDRLNEQRDRIADQADEMLTIQRELHECQQARVSDRRRHTLPVPHERRSAS